MMARVVVSPDSNLVSLAADVFKSCTHYAQLHNRQPVILEPSAHCGLRSRAGATRLQGMNAKEKAVEMRHLAKLCNLSKASEQERKQILEGGSILLNSRMAFQLHYWRKKYASGRYRA